MTRTLALALAAALALPGAVLAQTLTVQGADGHSVTLTDAQLRDQHRVSVTVPWGEHHTYAGAPLGDLLALVGAPSDARLHGPALDQVVLVTGSDHFMGVLAIAETSKAMRDAPVILADEEDGKPLDAKQGPWRLIVGGDLKPARSVRMVTTIELRPVK
ncbi:molybdopterin-dependent oxidoreductase [Phenylobacterium montanum]|uniref:Molybdopterin-dependent oxidoreductase n=1 Tax=Phenylobacterium montanum TaxID=2823693 RepID=A0A975FXE5_9CAUL|nr:molybdopterin-dependent oxidoreductase [Caulobacter sp. S6]QUD86066.1 molybdopterin-dependent oxidoreductase [Caulobacter sp. S6]